MKEISPFRYATVEMTPLIKKHTTKLDFVGLYFIPIPLNYDYTKQF